MKKAFFGLAAAGIITAVFYYLTSGRRIMNKITGNYQIIEKEKTDKSWHLYIGTHNGDDNFFTIYDNHGKIGGKEDPWVVGTLVKTEFTQLSIKIDEELFNTYDFGWKIQDGLLILDYVIDDDILSLTNNGITMTFKELVLYTNHTIQNP